MRLIRLAILLGGCFFAASATWADDLGYVDCSNYPGNTQVQAKAAKTHEEAVASLPCGEHFTILASGAFFTRIQTKDGKVGYVHSYLVSRDDPATSMRQPSPAPAAAKPNAAPPLPAARGGFSAWAPRATTPGWKPVQPAPAQAPAPTSQVAAPAAPAAQPEPTTPAQRQPIPVQAAPAQALAPNANIPAATPMVEQTKPTTPAEAQPTAAQAAPTQTPAPAANIPAAARTVEPIKPTTPAEAQPTAAQAAPTQAPAPAANVPAATPMVEPPKPTTPAEPQLAPAQPAPAAKETPKVSAPSDTVVEPKPTALAQPEPAPTQPTAEAPRNTNADWGRSIPSINREPMAELFGGYSYMRLSGTGYGSNIHGALGSLGWNFRPWLQLVADTSYSVATVSGTKNVLYGNHFGPRIFFRPRSGRGATPFVEGLFGGSRLDTTSGGYKTSVNGFSVKAGGGLDWKLSPHVTVRLINADYYRTSFGGASQNNYTASTGFILRLFGGGPQ